MIDAPALSHFPDYTTSFHRVPGACTRCHAMHHVFVNRNGRTHCLACDTELKETYAKEKTDTATR